MKNILPNLKGIVLALLLCLVFSGCYLRTFNTTQGTTIQTNDIPSLNDSEIERSLEFFAVEFPKLVKNVTEAEVRRFLHKAKIEWKPSSFRCNIGWCDGSQLRYNIKVKWSTRIQDTPLFHELAHGIMEFTQGVLDFKHEWKEWWDAVDKMNLIFT